MRQLDKNKVRHLSKFSQLILLNEEAHIVSSCNSIFPTQSIQNIPVINWFPFLESIFEYLFQLTPESTEVRFSKIETPIQQLPGIYDFTFSKALIDERELLLWAIYDYTDLYEDFKHYQQRKNEFEILRETLERRFKNLKSKSDVYVEQNIILENFNHFQLNYFNKLKSALQSPVNALDGFTYVLSNSLEKGAINYIEALKKSIFDIEEIIEELQSIQKSNVEQKRFGNQYTSFDPRKVIRDIILLVRERFDVPLEINIEIRQIVPHITGNDLLLGQILFGLLTNIFRFHQNSRLHVLLDLLKQDNSGTQIRLQVTEYLGRKDVVLAKEDIRALILRLSVVKQLVDLQKGGISVEKDAKSLGITVTCDLEYPLK